MKKKIKVPKGKVLVRQDDIIRGDVFNSEGDMFPWEELKKMYKTFIGIEITDSSNMVIGKIVDSNLIPQTKSIAVVGEVDKKFKGILESGESWLGYGDLTPSYVPVIS